MADIREAAKWLLKDQTVRRSSWVSGATLKDRTVGYNKITKNPKTRSDFRFEIDGTKWQLREWMLDDLLADDCEIAPQP